MNSKLTASAERVVWLLNKVWHGSQSRMAEETGISQSAISNVVTGRQQPGRKMLEKLSSSALVNSTWLVTGHGDPLITVGGESGRRASYVARRLFEGLPEDNGDCLGHMLEVPLPYYRPSRYWLQVDDDSPLLRIGSLRLASGDAVLFEPEAEAWPENVCGHPCIVKHEGTLMLNCVTRASAKQVWLSDAQSKSLSDFKKVDGKYERDLILDGEEAENTATRSEVSQARTALVALGIFRMGAFRRDDLPA